MENMNQATLESKVITTLDFILNMMADLLKDSFDPADPETMKLLREFRATMNSRRAWIKSCGLNETNEDTCNTIIKKVESSANSQPASAVQKPGMMNKPGVSDFDATICEGIHFKNNPRPQVNVPSGLTCRR